MEENVALDSSKQKKFVKSIKKLIKKSDKEPIEKSEPVENVVKKSKRKRQERGLVYLSHIPHGFYEHEMTQYFKQFGVVTNVRVIRSKRTGNSKGYAFVEFKEPTVAEIVAETMNNYLMGKRLIKAALIPPEKQRPKAMRKHWNRVHNPGAEARLKIKKNDTKRKTVVPKLYKPSFKKILVAHNQIKDEKGDLKRARKIINNLNKTKSRLSELGIDYDFFTPVDVPGALVSLLENKETDKKTETPTKDKNKVAKQADSITKSKKNKEVEEDNKKEKKNKVEENTKAVNTKKTDKEKISKKESKDKKEREINQNVDKKVQKNKENKLKQARVKPAEDFIKVQEESDDSDSSLDFDSDEYEKMMGDDDSDVNSDDESEIESGDDDNENESDDDGSESDDEHDSDDEESEEEVSLPPLKVKGKGPIIKQPPKTNKQVIKQKPKKQEQGKETEIVKRKITQTHTTTSKKPKFEKQTQQPMKKQFKKKK